MQQLFLFFLIPFCAKIKLALPPSCAARHSIFGKISSIATHFTQREKELYSQHRFEPGTSRSMVCHAITCAIATTIISLVQNTILKGNVIIITFCRILSCQKNATTRHKDKTHTSLQFSETVNEAVTCVNHWKTAQ